MGSGGFGLGAWVSGFGFSDRQVEDGDLFACRGVASHGADRELAFSEVQYLPRAKILIGLMSSDRKLKASREGSK